MDLFDVQRALAARGWYSAPVDGQWGPKTRAGVERLLDSYDVNYSLWSDTRKTVSAYQAVCRAAGIDAGKIDGLEGPQTRYAREVFDARKAGDKATETWRDTKPVPARPTGQKTFWPVQADVRKVYGEPGANQTLLTLPYPMRLAWDTGTKVTRISIHEMVAPSAGRVLARVLDHYGPIGIADLGLDLFGGCLNVRAMRGGSALSMHSWGIAIDIDPDRNQLKWGRDRARLARPDGAKWFELWEEEGWVSLGRRANYDWMHVQAARL